MKELVKHETGEIITAGNNVQFEQFSQPVQDITSNEIVIPKIIPMQGQSPQVLAGDAAFGELRDTLNNDIMAAAESGKKAAVPMTFIPFHWEKYYITKVQDGAKWKFEKMEKITPAMAKLDPYECWSGADGRMYKRIFLHLFYVLVPGKAMPYTIGFKGSSKRAGDALVTNMFVINKMNKSELAWKRSPMARVMSLIPKKESKEGNTYIVLEAKPLRDSTYEEACEALQWLSSFRTSNVQVDNSDIIHETEATVLQNSDF